MGPSRLLFGGLVLRHVARAAGVLLAVSLLAFCACEMAPGDPFAELRLSAQVSSGRVDALRDRFALDRPLTERYWLWLQSVLRGDLGHSIVYDAPIAPLLARRALNSLLLTGTALLGTWLVALPLGVWLAARARRIDGRVLGAGVTGLLAMPDLLIATSLLLVAAASGAFPAGGIRSLRDADGMSAAGDLLRHLFLPALAIVLSAAPAIVRHVRAAMIEVLGAPYLVAAAAKGVPSSRLLFRSALRAAANPLISLFGLSLAALFSASMVVEVVMSWPGLGPLFLDAVRSRDVHLVVAGVLCSAVLLIVGNGCADMLLHAADPRDARTAS